MKKGAIELETIVKIIIVLFALILLVMFLTGNFQNIGGGLSNIGQNVTGQAPTVTGTIGGFNISSG